MYNNRQGTFMKKRGFSFWAVALLASLSFNAVACNKTGSRENTKKPDPVKATRVYVSNLACDLFVDLSYTVNPILYPYNATNNIKYEIQNPNVLQNRGNDLYGLSEGNSLVYVYDDFNQDGVRNEDEAFTVMAFSVTNSDASIYIDVDREITISVDESKKLTYEVIGGSASGLDYGFYSEDDSICTISGGIVKGHKAGKTRVSVSWQGYRGYCTVNVVDKVDEQGIRASEIISDVETLILEKGQTKQLKYKILPKKSVDSLDHISVTNEKVLRVEGKDKITAIGGGSSVVTFVTTNNKIARMLVTVKDDALDNNSYYNNYYGNLTWEDGADLKSKLHNIISQNVTPLRYDSPNWESNQAADQYLYDFSFIKGVYNDDPILKSNTNTGWQREHAFAASLMTGFSTGNAVKAYGRATDFHNLFAASAGANGSRGNKNYGYVNLDSAELSSKENCLYTRKAWEPADDDKGRLARAIFYMDVMYNRIETVDVTETWTYRGSDISTHEGQTKAVHVNVDEKALSIVENNVDYSRISINDFMYPQKDSTSTIVEYYRSLIRAEQPTLETSDYDAFREQAYERYLNTSMPYAIGHYSDLLKWSAFPVDIYEMQHNNSVYSYNSTTGRGTQGNRNPFVDYPQFIDYIYGDLKDQPGCISMLVPSYAALEMEQNEIHHYAVDSESLDAFMSGNKPTAADFDIKAIKNDLSKGVLDLSKIHVEDYTFTDDDVETGKVITITTDKNTLYVPVKVTSDAIITFDTCNWSYIAPSSNAKDAYVGSNGVFAAMLNGMQFDVTSSNTSITLSNRNTDRACRFGTTSVSAGTLTFVTKNAVSIDNLINVNAVFFNVACGSSKTFNYKVMIGSTIIGTGQCNGTFKDYSVIISEPLQGKITIEFSNISSYIDVHGLAINAIE